MDERRPKRSDDDVPIIGDFSEAHDANLRASTPPPRAEPTGSRASPTSSAGEPRRETRARDDRLLIDPSDMQRHARLARQRERPRSGKLRVYASIAIVAALAGAAYWNFDTLRGITFDFSEVTSLFAGDPSAPGGSTSRSGGALETAPVESQAVAGAAVPTSLGDARPAAAPSQTGGESLPSRQPGVETAPVAVAEPAPVATVAVADTDNEQVARAEPPPPPPEPERFEFGLPVNTVSEGDPAAAILILRTGDRRAASTVTWWTSPGTATAGTDYVDLGKVTVKFASGEQNRTIRIPIIGDRVVEGPESFYVHLEVGEGAGGPAEAMPTEVVIQDDD